MTRRLFPLALAAVVALAAATADARTSEAAAASDFQAVGISGQGIVHVSIKGGFTLRAKNALVSGWTSNGSRLILVGVDAEPKVGAKGWAGAYRARSLSVSGACPTGCQLSVKADLINALVDGCGSVTMTAGRGGYTLHSRTAKFTIVWDKTVSVGLREGLDFNGEGCGGADANGTGKPTIVG